MERPSAPRYPDCTLDLWQEQAIASQSCRIVVPLWSNTLRGIRGNPRATHLTNRDALYFVCLAMSSSVLRCLHLSLPRAQRVTGVLAHAIIDKPALRRWPRTRIVHEAPSAERILGTTKEEVNQDTPIVRPSPYLVLQHRMPRYPDCATSLAPGVSAPGYPACATSLTPRVGAPGYPDCALLKVSGQSQSRN